jgi:hypothetical protein
MLQVKFTFDENNYRHAVNGHESVLHCHHYMCLTTKVAHQFAKIGGAKILRESAEDSIRPMLDSYIAEHHVKSPEDRLAIGAEYYAVFGMGLMEINGDAESGEVRLLHSHIDEGWIKKFGKSDRPINDFTRGFVAAVFAAAFDKPARSYEVRETASIATGEKVGVLMVRKA